MANGSWIDGPIGLDARGRIARTADRTVLVLVPHVVAGTRLNDLLPLFEGDPRLQVVFTVPTTGGGHWSGPHEVVRSPGGLAVPWERAVRHEFDLVLAASYRGSPAWTTGP